MTFPKILFRTSLLCAAVSCTIFAIAPLSIAQNASHTSAPGNDAQTFHLIPGLDKSVMDTGADPCADFYQYACGNWGKQHPIPSDAPYSDQFYNLQEYNQQVLHAILERAAAAHAAPGTDEQKIGDYYATCMDDAAINAKGLAPFRPELNRIAALKTKADLGAYLAHAQLINDGAFLGFGKMQDFQDATHNVAVISQSGLGLPERDYYLRTGAKDQEIRDQYVTHIAKMFVLVGEPEAQAKSDAAEILRLETALARVSLDATALRDPKANYHFMPRSDLKKLAPTIDWDAFLRGMGTPEFTNLNIAQPDFMIGLNTVLQHEDMAAIRAYLRWQYLLVSVGADAPKALDDESFDFYSRKLTGTPEQEPRWKRCTSGVDAHIGEALGKLYVEEKFPPSSKVKTLEMIHTIEAAMDQDLETIDWMTPATKKEAREKLRLMTDKIGYPDKWREYSKLDIVRGDALGNYTRSLEFENRRQWAQIGQPVDRGEWAMTPPTVNAYYDPSMNDINFPAGVLQLAFYDPQQSDALNYGHIGLFMGHEITHGFDDEGRQFDGHGNLRDWWTKEDAYKFDAKEQCIVNEYSAFQATPDTHLNGKLSLGENTADNGGLRLVYIAYLANESRAHDDIHKKNDSGYTSEQEFFVGFAQDWCAQWRPELERLIATTDPHSPDRFRANGVLVNFPEFATAFGCKAGSKMVSAHACRVW
jgi:putative endopeptidase